MFFSDANFIGSVVNFECLPNNTLYGSKDAKCIDNNPQPKWNSPSPKCCVNGTDCRLPEPVKFYIILSFESSSGLDEFIEFRPSWMTAS